MCMLTHTVAGQVILSSFGGMALFVRLWYFIFVCTWAVCLMPVVTVVYFDLIKFFLQFCCQSMWFGDSHAKHSMKDFFFFEIHEADEDFAYISVGLLINYSPHRVYVSFDVWHFGKKPIWHLFSIFLSLKKLMNLLLYFTQVYTYPILIIRVKYTAKKNHRTQKHMRSHWRKISC